MSERQDIRAELLAAMDRDEPGWRDRYPPGSHGCHEAMHMASVLADLVGQRLAEHPAVLMQDKWHCLAVKAHQALVDLYQAIGAEHMDDQS